MTIDDKGSCEEAASTCAAPTERTPLAPDGGKAAVKRSRRRSLLHPFLELAQEGQQGSGYVPSIDAMEAHPWERRRRSCNRRRSVFRRSVETSLSASDPVAHEALTNSFAGYSFQFACLLATIAAYGASPLVTTWATTVGTNPDGSPIRETTFLEVTVVVLAKLFFIAVAMLIAIYDYILRGETRYLTDLFDLTYLLKWLPVSLGWAISDVAEVMASGRIDPSTYTVLVQTRIVLTALMLRLTSGVPRSQLQWSNLLLMTLAIIGWNMTPNRFGATMNQSHPSEAFGIFLTCLRVGVSVVTGVIGQRVLQENPLPVYQQQAQVCTASLLWTLLMFPVMLYYVYPCVLHKPWDYGLFGGPSTPFGDGFSSIRPWVVVGTYIFREYTVNLCVKNFDVVVKTLCHAFAAVLVYYINTVVMHAVPFNMVKGIFTLIIGMEIVHFAVAQDMMPTNGDKEVVEHKLRV